MKPGPVEVRTLPAARGMTWLTAGLELLQRQLIRFLLLGLLLQLLAGLTRFGVLGILFMLAIPALTAGMLQAFRTAEAGQKPPPGLLLAAFGQSDRLPRLALLGGLMLLVAVAAVMAVLSGVIAGLDLETLQRLEQGDLEALLAAEPGVIERVALALAAGLAISGMLSYFSIPLIWFFGLPLGQSLVLGIKAMLSNWKPLLVLGLFLAILAVPAVLLLSMALGAAAVGVGQSPLLGLVVMAVSVAYQLVIFATQYTAFREIFGLQPTASEPPGDEDQLVA